MNEQRTIGIDRPVKLEWLDAAAGRLAVGDSERAARDYVWNMLEGVISGNTPYTARGKTMTVISRIWITIPEVRRPFRERALCFIEGASPEERLAIHWAMMLAAYPFFFELSENMGKLLQLHGSFALAQLVRRIVDRWGDRSTLRTGIQRLVRMMANFGVITEGEGRGEYERASHKLRVSGRTAALLVEAYLLCGKETVSENELRSFSAAFPFELSLAAGDLRRSPQFEIHREGQEDVVTLRRARR